MSLNDAFLHALREADPGAYLFAQAAHTELVRRGTLPPDVTLSRWVADAVHERARLATLALLGLDQPGFELTPAMDKLGGANLRTLHVGER